MIEEPYAIEVEFRGRVYAPFGDEKAAKTYVTNVISEALRQFDIFCGEPKLSVSLTGQCKCRIIDDDEL